VLVWLDCLQTQLTVMLAKEPASKVSVCLSIVRILPNVCACAAF